MDENNNLQSLEKNYFKDTLTRPTPTISYPEITGNMYVNNDIEVPEYLIEEAMRMRNRPQSIDEAIYTDGKALSLHETIPSNNVDINTLLALKEELLSLGEPERSIMEKRYFEDLTQAETAKKLGLTQVQVSRNEQKVLSLLRNNLFEKAS